LIRETNQTEGHKEKKKRKNANKNTKDLKLLAQRIFPLLHSHHIKKKTHKKQNKQKKSSF